MDSADHHNHNSVPQSQAFDWPPRGSLDYMQNWTLEKGITTLETRMAMQGRCLEPSPLSPMSESAHAPDHLRLPSTTSSGTPSYRGIGLPSSAYSDSLGKVPENSIALLDRHGPHKRRKDTHPPSKCFSCGLPWLDARQESPSGGSSHWFVDIHDGVSRKVAYLFCWRCVGGVQRRLRPSRHLGCGHPLSLPLPLVAGAADGLMFCRGCRDLVGGGAGGEGLGGPLG